MKAHSGIEKARIQMRRLVQIARQLELHPPRRTTALSIAEVFAEWLILCPDEDSAIEKMRKDRSGAEAFLSVALCCILGIHAGAIVREKSASVISNPFYEIAELVLEFLRGYRTAHPDDWT